MKGTDEQDRWQQVDATFERVLRTAPEERGRLIESLCGEDHELRAEVESLLSAHLAAGGFLETPADRVAAPYLAELLDGGADLAGKVIGRYRLIEEIGRGGMGAVWLAERADGEYEQRVAVKLVKRGMDTDEILDRFMRERRILARLEHTNIARILDGGATPDGRPYFVMEHVAGAPVTEYCEVRQLSIEERLALFEVVCRAVQYAHRNLVVHRDLKPSNVLVTEDGEVKLLDFGIAKLVEEDGDEIAAQLTRTGMRFVTPDYASPEQIRGEPVTTQSDVYQLGLLLFEILAGRRPYQLRGKSPTEVERIVCQEEPTRPSATARDRDIGRRLQGDLDTIVMTALRKEAPRRYASAEAMAEDVRRYLDRLPLRARGDGAGYRAGKFLRRHRVPVAAAGALLALSSAFAVVYTMRLKEERDRVRLEAEKATASAELLERFFVSWNPDEADRDEVSAREILDVAAARAERGTAEEPQVQAAMFSLIGSLYAQLGAYDRAESLLVRAEAIQRRAYAEPHADLAATTERLGRLRYARGDQRGAEERYREALAMNRALHGPSHPRTLAAHASLASALWLAQRYDEAEVELRALLSLRSGSGDLPIPVAEAMSTLGVALFFQGRLEEAEAALREALARQRPFFGDDDPITLDTAGNLAAVLRDRGELDEAERIQRGVLDRVRARYGDAHQRTLVARLLLAMVLERKSEYEEAEGLMRGIITERQRVFGSDDPSAGGWMVGLGSILLDRGELGEAENTLRRSQVILGRSMASDEEAGDALNRIAYIRIQRGDPNARTDYLAARAFHRSRPPNDPQFVTDGFHFLAWSMHRMGDRAEAEALYRRALELYRPALPPDHQYLAATLSGLGELLLDLGRPGEAEPYLREAVSAWSGRERPRELAQARDALSRAAARQ